MELTDDDIQEFIESWRTDFGETLTPERARSEALRLVDFFLTMEEELWRMDQEDEKERQKDEKEDGQKL